MRRRRRRVVGAEARVGGTGCQGCVGWWAWWSGVASPGTDVPSH
nr:hypothetical protein [Streptomyces sp.]